MIRTIESPQNTYPCPLLLDCLSIDSAVTTDWGTSVSVRYSPKSHISLAKYENNYPYLGLKIEWKSLNDVQWDRVNVDQFDKLNESLGSWGEIIGPLFFFGILSC